MKRHIAFPRIESHRNKKCLLFSLVAALLLSSCIRFSPQDFCRRGPAVDNWISATTDRINKANTDPTIDALGLQQLYLGQYAQQTPACLSTAQAHAVETFLQQWQAAGAIERDDSIGFVLAVIQSRLASAQLANELRRLADLNAWPPVP